MSDSDDEVLRDPARLDALAQTGLLDDLPQSSLDRYTRIASLCIGAPVALVSLVDQRRQFFSSLTGLPEPWASRRETPLSHSFCQLVVKTGEELIVSDAAQDQRVAGNLAIPELGVMAYAGKPIRTSDQHVLGSFCVIDTRPRAWTNQELTLLDELCGAVTAEVELRRRANRQRASERELASANREVTDASQASSLLHRQAIHDMRTPLGVVIMGVSHLRKHEALSSFPEMARMLERVSRNANHTAALLASMEAGHQERAEGVASDVTSDLNVISAQVVHDLASSTLAIEHAPCQAEALRVPLAETDLRRCLENVLSNARRFAVQRVVVTTQALRGEAQVWFDDDGPGLPSVEAFANVWQRDVRYHVDSGRSGSGLGLSIVKELVERAGGRVQATVSPLGGARFILALPTVGAPVA